MNKPIAPQNNREIQTHNDRLTQKESRELTRASWLRFLDFYIYHTRPGCVNPKRGLKCMSCQENGIPRP